MRKLFALLLFATLSTALVGQNVSDVPASVDEPVIDKVVAVVGKNIVKMSEIENGYVQIRIRQGYERPMKTAAISSKDC